MFIISTKKNGVFICVGFYRVSKLFCFQCVQFGFIVLFLIIFLSKFTINNSKSNLTNVGKKKIESICNVMQVHSAIAPMHIWRDAYVHLHICFVQCVIYYVRKLFSTPSKTLYLFLSKKYSSSFFFVTNTNFI